MIDLFERFGRGRMLDNPTLISMTFAKHMLQLFEMEGCMIDADRVDMAKLRQKIEDQTFDTSLFNQLIKNDCSYMVKSRNFEI